MRERPLVRIMGTTLENFKNVSYGNIHCPNRSSVEGNAEIISGNISGIYGANGSGKTAVTGSLDMLQCMLRGESVPFSEYEGMFFDSEDMCLGTVFFIENKDEQFKIAYDLKLRKNKEDRRIQIQSEQIQHWIRRTTWKEKHEFFFVNPFYDLDNVISNEPANVTPSNTKPASQIGYFGVLQNLAVFYAQKNCSLFLNKQFIRTVCPKNGNEEERKFSVIMKVLFDFAQVGLQVVKADQLSDNCANRIIPVNVHTETGNETLKGCVPLLVSGSGEFPETIYLRLVKIIDAINIALKAVIPNLRLEFHKTSEEINGNGVKVVRAKVFSIRDRKTFSTEYESAGIKRIISLLNYLISVYNDSVICLVADELDTGILEYLLGESIGELSEGAKGQLIFISHNLHIMEKLDKKNIICSTINPNNRYISLKGIEKTHN